MFRSIKTLTIGIGVATAVSTGAAMAQSFPERPVTIVVPYGAGGTADSTARTVAELITDDLGQPVVVENRPGAGGIVATMSVINAPADGYTLLMCGSALSFAPVQYNNPPFQTEDLQPVSLLLRVPYVLAVGADSDFEITQDLIDYAKAHPGELNLATTGPGTADTLGRWFAHQEEIDIAPIAYNGSAAMEQALMAGDVHMAFTNLSTGLQRHKSGQLRILGIAADDRIEVAPDLPTLTEQDLSDPYVAESWIGICAPAGTPMDIVNQLSEAFQSAVAEAGYQEFVKNMTSIPQATTPEGLAELTARTREIWGRMIEELNLKLDAPT